MKINTCKTQHMGNIQRDSAIVSTTYFHRISVLNISLKKKCIGQAKKPHTHAHTHTHSHTQIYIRNISPYIPRFCTTCRASSWPVCRSTSDRVPAAASSGSRSEQEQSHSPSPPASLPRRPDLYRCQLSVSLTRHSLHHLKYEKKMVQIKVEVKVEVNIEVKV